MNRHQLEYSEQKEFKKHLSTKVQVTVEKMNDNDVSQR
jgi:hypothetical protein